MSSEMHSSSNCDLVAAPVVSLWSHFNAAQRSSRNHKPGAAAVRKLLAMHRDSVVVEFFECISRVLLVGKKEPAVDRLIVFIALVACGCYPSPVLPKRVDLDEDEEGEGKSERRKTCGGSAVVEEVMDVCGCLLEWTANKLDAANKVVRQRGCQLIAAVMDLQGEDATVSDALFQHLEEVLLPRLRDKIPAVRRQAIAATRRLQTGDGGEDRVWEELLRLMRCDPSADVRRAAMTSILVTKDALPHLVHRCRDTSPAVREAAYMTLSDKVDQSFLSPRQRCQILGWGLRDQSTSVSNAARRMLCGSWVHSVGGNVSRVIDLVDPLEDENVADEAAAVLVSAGWQATFAHMEGKPPPFGLSPEESCTLRSGTRPGCVTLLTSLSPSVTLLVVAQVEALLDIVQSYGGTTSKSVCGLMSPAEREESLEAILPETADLCSLIERASCLPGLEDQPETLYILRLLLRLCRCCDGVDEGGRQRMRLALGTILRDPNSPNDLMEESLRCLASINPVKSDFIRLVAEMMSDVVEEEDADDITEAGDGEPLDPDEQEERRVMRQIRALELCSLLLDQTERPLASDATLKSMESTILPAIGSPYGIAREIGVTCLGKYCLLGIEAALRHRDLLIHVSEAKDDDTGVRACALQSVMDLCLLYGEAFLKLEDNRVINLIEEALRPKFLSLNGDEWPQALSAVAAEGAAKLLFCRCIAAERTPLTRIGCTLMGLLLAAFFARGSCADPKTLSLLMGEGESGEQSLDEDGPIASQLGSPVRLHQLLSIFFPCFFAMPGPDGLRAIISSVPPMLATLSSYGIDEMEDSNVEQAIKFIVGVIERIKHSGSSSEPRDSKNNPACSPVDNSHSQNKNQNENYSSTIDCDVNAPDGNALLPVSKDPSAPPNSCTSFIAMAVLYEMSCIKDKGNLKCHITSLAKSLAHIPLPQEGSDVVALLAEFAQDLALGMKDRGASKLVVKYAEACESLADGRRVPDEKWEELCLGADVTLRRSSCHPKHVPSSTVATDRRGDRGAVQKTRIQRLRASKRQGYFSGPPQAAPSSPSSKGKKNKPKAHPPISPLVTESTEDTENWCEEDEEYSSTDDIIKVKDIELSSCSKSNGSVKSCKMGKTSRYLERTALLEINNTIV